MRFSLLLMNVTLLSSVSGAVERDPGQDVCLGLI